MKVYVARVQPELNTARGRDDVAIPPARLAALAAVGLSACCAFPWLLSLGLGGVGAGAGSGVGPLVGAGAVLLSVALLVRTRARRGEGRTVSPGAGR